MITIYKNNGEKRTSVPVTESSVYRKELMKEEFVKLVFSTAEQIGFRNGDYIETEFGRFEITDLTLPTINPSTGSLDYELRFDDVTARWKKRILFYDRQGNKEKAWTLTRQPEYFLDIVVSNLKEAGLGTYDYSIGEDVEDKSKALGFDSRSIFDALTDIAEEWDTEWYVSGQMIHLGKCEFGTEIVLDKNNMAEISRQDGETSNYATRIYPFGSTRNLPTGYRGKQENSVIEGIVEKRLMLPPGAGDYLDARENMEPEDIVEAVVVFDEVYPKRIGTITAVAKEERFDTVEKEDGTTEKVSWYAWFFRDEDLTFSDKYVLDGQDLRVAFQSHRLNGLEFTLAFHADYQPKGSSYKGQWFEIVRNEDYGVALPNENLSPDPESKYILYGMDYSMIGDIYVPEAEQELYETARNYLKKISIDPSVYQCKTNPVRCAGYLDGGFDSSRVMDFDAGQRVRLMHPVWLGEEGRGSRIYGFEKKLENKFECTYFIGESPSYSRIGDLESKIEELTYKGKTFVSTGKDGVYLITRYDATTPSDLNAYSALRSEQEFLNKNRIDTAKRLLNLLEGARFGEFIPGPLGDGAYIDPQGNGEMTSLTLRSFLEAPEFRYNRIQVVGGELYATNGALIAEVEEDEGSYRITLKIEEGDHVPFVVDDILLGSYLKPDGFFSSYMRIIHVDDAAHTIRCVLGKDSEVPGGVNRPPVPFMNLVQYGNFTDESRQSSIRISSHDKCITMLDGVNNYLTGKSNIAFGLGAAKNFPIPDHLPVNKEQSYLYARGIVVQDSHQITYDGQEVQQIEERGWWSREVATSDHPYRYTSSVAHDVWHNSCRYRCIVDKTTQEPRWNSTDWLLISGNPNFTIDIESSNGLDFDYGEVDTILSVVGRIHHTDVTQELLDSDIAWTRESGNITEDDAWAIRHASAGKSIHITTDDVGGFRFVNNGGCKFICTAYLRDGNTITEAKQEIPFGL